MIHIALFASGTGSNVRKIVAHFENSGDVSVALVVSNRKNAPVLDFAREKGLPTLVLDRQSFYGSTGILDQLRRYRVDLIVLAGFLWLIPPYLVAAFRNRILNIHPALLPKYGGKGMYGHHVHEAVLAAAEQESGITIHLVDEQYDHGSMIFQARCPVLPDDTPDSLAQRVQQLEHQHYPIVIDQYIRDQFPSRK